MDVRCEKCQTEYELDESRLKPGGVTVKCTNCGHMFKIRKRANTNVGVAAGGATATPSAGTPAAAAPPPPTPDRARTPSKQPRAESVSGAPSETLDSPSGPVMSGSGERQWMVRLENGETKSCKELATLQQWIVAGVVSRESLISRSGKTWKRLGDIAELSGYFVIADEARASRSVKSTGKAGNPAMAGTMLGLGTVPAASPKARPPASDDDLEGRTTGSFRVRPPTPPPPPPVAASAAAAAPPPRANPVAQTEVAASAPVRAAPIHDRVTEPPQPKNQTPRIAPPADPGRQTAAWAQQDVKASESMAAMPQGPRGGKLSASPDEKAYGGRVRLQPSDDVAFKNSSKVREQEDDDDADLYPQRRGSRAGMWIVLISLLVIGAAAGAVYMFVFNKKEPVATVTGDAGPAAATADAMAVVVTPFDAGVETANPLEGARAELLAGVTARMQTTLDGLAGKDDPASLAIRARLSTAMAQSMQDRAMYVDKTEADKLRKAAKQLVVDTAPLAQRAFNGQQDSASANLAMADVLRLQAKPAPAVKRYVETARSKAAGDKELVASVALAEAQLAVRDGKLPDAQKALASVDAPDDMRVKIALAQIAHAQNKPADAKALVEQVLATQPDHDVALAMYKKLETSVASTDPLPPEDGSNAGSGSAGSGSAGSGSATTATPTPNPNNNGGGGDTYDSLLAKGNKLAETNCGKAIELFAKALELKSNGVEALTGMGYCHLDAKQFSSAFSKFRAALGVSSRYEPALGGIAETYQRQGNKEAAIEAWKKYLEFYPTSPKAKKQLEILGADSGGGTPPEPKKPDGDGSATAPTPTPTPTPTPPPPTPTPEAGSASN